MFGTVKAQSISLLPTGMPVLEESRCSSGVGICGHAQFSESSRAQLTSWATNTRRSYTGDHFGLFKEHGEGPWGTYYGALYFSHEDGKIYAAGPTVVGTWEPGRWYRVKVILDRQTNRYSVWIDGELRASDLPDATRHPEIIEAIALVAGHDEAKVYYDDVRVFEVTPEAHSPVLELSAHPKQVRANDRDISLLTLIYRDENGRPVTGRTIRFFSSRGNSDTFSAATAVTDSNGEASVTIRSGVVGVSTITCRDETANTDLPVSAQVTFYQPEVKEPVIGSVRTDPDVRGPFLERVPLPYHIIVEVSDWGGSPGWVQFRMPDGSLRQVQASGNHAVLTTDAGSDLKYGIRPQWNEIRITAYNSQGMASNPVTISLLTVPLPVSLQPFKWLDVPICRTAPNKITYELTVEWPMKVGVDASASPNVNFALLNGLKWGSKLPPFKAKVKLELRAPKPPGTFLTGTVEARIETAEHKLYFAGFEIKAQGWASTQWQVSPLVKMQSLSLGLSAGTKWESPDLLPILTTAPPTNLLAPLTLVLDLFGRVSPKADGAILFREEAGDLVFGESSLKLKFPAELVLSLDRAYRDFVSVEGMAGLEPKVDLVFPGKQQNVNLFGVPFFNRIGVEGYIRFKVVSKVPFLSASETYDLGSFSLYHPSGSLAPMGVPVDKIRALPRSRWSEPSRDYLWRAPYHRLHPAPTLRPAQGGQDVEDILLVSDIFPYADPVLVWKGYDPVIVYVYDDPNLPAHQSTAIRALHWTDGDWADLPVTNDTALDSQPDAGVTPDGKLVAVWTRMENVPPDPDPAQRLPLAEVVYSVFDENSQQWSAPVKVTNDNLLDCQPRLVRGANGHLYLMWLKSPDNYFPMEPDNPNVPHVDVWAARWTGTQFASPRLLVPNVNSLEVATAVDSWGQVTLVWSHDPDGNRHTDNSQLVYTFYDGWEWQPVQPVWVNSYPQGAPSMTIGGDGKPVLFFVRSGVPKEDVPGYTEQELMATTFTGTTWAMPVGTTRSNIFGDLEVMTTPDGRASAMWVCSSEGVADIWTVVADPSVGVWSKPVRLTKDDMTHEVQVRGAWSPDGYPTAVYLKTRLEQVEQQYQDEQGNWHTIEVTQPVGRDLYLLLHEPMPDLTIAEGGLRVEPQNAGPGEEVTLTAQVHNLRALGVSDVQVGFYDGNPDDGGTLIATATVTPNPLRGGDVGVASIRWTVPTDGKAHVVYARVDPDNTVWEVSEDNNTASYPIALLDLEAVLPIVERFLPDGKVVLRFGVRNASHVNPEAPVKWQLRLGDAEGDLLAEGTLLAPRAGQSAEVQWVWEPQLNAGRYDLTLLVDTDNALAESDEANNVSTNPVALLADLSLNPALTHAVLTSDSRVKVDVWVQNEGWASAQNVVVQILDAPPGKGRVVDSRTLPLMERGAVQSYTFVSRPLVPGRRLTKVWVVVNPQGTVEEIRRDNNTLELNVRKRITVTPQPR